MAAAKSERILNLLIALLSTKRFLTKHELRELVEGYRGMDSFERTFERDKKELRDLGIPIEMGITAADSEEEGYRIDRGDFELPEVEFTRDELVALGLATHAWQTSVGAEATAEVLLRLRAAGAAPDVDNLPGLQARIPVSEPHFDAFYEALFARREIAFDYDGNRRRLQPWRLKQRRGQWLVEGFDLDRQAPRRFRLSRVTGLPKALGRAGAYEIPEDTEQMSEPSAAETAVVAVRDAPALRSGATPVDAGETLPEGFDAMRVTRLTRAMIVDDVCEAGADAFVLAPPEVRDAVAARLRGLIGGKR